MKVKGSHTTTNVVDVDVRPDDALKELVALMKDAHGFPRDSYVNEKGQIVRDEEYYTSHSWFEERIVNANPAPAQLEVFTAIDAFRKQLRIAIAMEKSVKGK